MAVEKNVKVTVDGWDCVAAEADVEARYVIYHRPLMRGVVQTANDFGRWLTNSGITYERMPDLPLAEVYKIVGEVKIVTDTPPNADTNVRAALELLFKTGIRQAELTIRLIDYVKDRFSWNGLIEETDFDDHQNTATFFADALIRAKVALDKSK